jgi:hypothetical protein
MSARRLPGWIPPVFVVVAAATLIIPALAPLVVPAIGVVAWWFCWLAVSEARSWGLRSSAVPLIWLIGALLFVCTFGVEIADLRTPLRQIDLLVHAVALLALLFCVWAPRHLVRVTGGPSAEWLVLRERAAMAFDPAIGRTDTAPAEEAAFEARLASLDRYRTSRTAEFIDLFQEWFRMPEPTLETAADEQRWLDHFHAVEWALVLSLKARPSWYDTYPWLSHVSDGPSEPLPAGLTDR